MEKEWPGVPETAERRFFSLGFPERGPWGARAAEKGRELHRQGLFCPTRGIIGGCLLLPESSSNKNQVEEIVDETVISEPKASKGLVYH